MFRPSATAGKGFGDCRRYLIGCSYECAVGDMGVARRRTGYSVTQQPRDRQFRKPQVRGCRGKAMAQDVDRDPIEAHSGANTVQYFGQTNEMPVALVGRKDPRLSSRNGKLSRSRIAAAPSGRSAARSWCPKPDTLMAPVDPAQGVPELPSVSALTTAKPNRSDGHRARSPLFNLAQRQAQRRISSRSRNRRCLPSGRRRTCVPDWR